MKSKGLQYMEVSSAAVAAKPQAYPDVVAMERIKLCKFLTAFGVGGTEKQVLNLALRLDKERFDLSFAGVRRWGEFVEEIERNGPSIAEYPITRLYGYRTLCKQVSLASDLSKNHIQILHSYNFYANAFAIPAARLARVPCVIASVRDLGIDLRPSQHRAQNWICRLADVVIVNADAIRDWLIEQGFPGRKIRVIRNGVDIEKFTKVEGEGPLRQELSIPQTAPIVIMLTRIAPNKGVEQFLQATPRIARLHPDAHFVIVGGIYLRDKDKNHRVDTALQNRLMQQAEKLETAEHIHFIGTRPDVPQILAAAAVSVLPSRSEGISNTLLESMAAGVPVVATKVGGTPELVRNGLDGILVPPGDAFAIADAVCAILGDSLLAKRLGAQGRERAAKSFSFETMTRNTEEVYFELMESKRRARKWRRQT